MGIQPHGRVPPVWGSRSAASHHSIAVGMLPAFLRDIQTPVFTKEVVNPLFSITPFLQPVSTSELLLGALKHKQQDDYFHRYGGLFLARFSFFHCLALGGVSVPVLHGWGLERHERKVLGNSQWVCASGAGHGTPLDQDNGRNIHGRYRKRGCWSNPAQSPSLPRPQILHVLLQVSPRWSPVSPV